MKKWIFIAAVAFTAAACGDKADNAQLKSWLDGKALVVDVRTPSEFASGHHPRAINVPVDQVQSRIGEFGDKSQPVVVYCHSGSRSSRAKQVLESVGFTQVTNAGGFRDLPQ